jgi:hypothetical protein
MLSKSTNIPRQNQEAIDMNATAKAEAELAFKPQSKQEDQPGRRTHVAMEQISDAELDRRLAELRNEQLRRVEAKREELEEGARHEWEKDREEALRIIKKIHERGGCREGFVEFASKSNGSFSPDLLFERSLPVSYLPDDLRPEGVTVVKKGRTGSAGARSALSEKAPEKGAGGETQEEIIVRVVGEKKGQPMSLEDVIFEISKDEVFGAYLKKEPRGMSRKIGGVAKRGLIKKTEKGTYVPA